MKTLIFSAIATVIAYSSVGAIMNTVQTEQAHTKQINVALSQLEAK